MLKKAFRRPATVVCFVLLSFVAMSVRAGQPRAGSDEIIRRLGPQVGLSLNQHGDIVYLRPDFKTGLTTQQKLSPQAAKRLIGFLKLSDGKNPQAAMADALKSFLKPYLSGVGSSLESMLFSRDAQGRLILTPTGQNVLMDILTAQDGVLLAPKPPAPGALAGLKNMEKTGQASMDSLSRGGDPSFANAAIGRDFDHASLSKDEVYALQPFNWESLGSQKERDLALQSFGISPEAARDQGHSLRVLVAAEKQVQKNRLFVQEARSDSGAIYKESGLNPSLFEKHGAKVVRAMGNLVAVDVPMAQAASLGKSLEQKGISSRPARIVQAAVAALGSAPTWTSPLRSALPFGNLSKAATAIQPQNFASRDILKVSGLWNRGMQGSGSIVGIIDSGLDSSHPDFKDRVLLEMDFTSSDPAKKDTQDYVGHGTHVAGSVGGSGAASDGLYKGMAPKTRFVIAKVFGRSGSTTEDTIIAAMKALKSLPKETRPQVVNMSLGGPGSPDHILSVTANEMMVKDNIMMVVAAGNSGPKPQTIGTPGNARYILTVTGVNKDRKIPTFPSRGPIKTADGNYIKPDISTVAGDVNWSKIGMKKRLSIWFRREFGAQGTENPIVPFSPETTPKETPAQESCYYDPGVISARSKDDADTACSLAGNAKYRFMTGTSMASPLAAGIDAVIIGYLNEKGAAYATAEVKALMMETADSLGEKPEVQGAGLVNGEKIAAALEERVRKSLPVGNIPAMLAQQLNPRHKVLLQIKNRFQTTPLGILDRKNKHLINNDAEFDLMAESIEADYKNLPFYERWWIDLQLRNS